MFMKRIIVALLVLTLAVNFAGSQGGAAAAETGRPGFSQFTDLFSRDVEYFKGVVRKFKDMGNHWADKAVGILVELKVIDGYPEDGTFRPENNITRAEFTKILVTSMKLDMKSGSSFADTADHWSKDYVNTAVVNGIIKSSEFGSSFLPDVNITRLEMAKMVVRAAGLGTQAEDLKGQATRFSDDGLIGYNDKGFIKLASEKKIINGYPEDGTFRPQGLATRAEASQMIINLLEYVSKTPGNTVTPNPTPTTTPVSTPTPTPEATKIPLQELGGMTLEIAKQDPILSRLLELKGIANIGQSPNKDELDAGFNEFHKDGRMDIAMKIDFTTDLNNYFIRVYRDSDENQQRLKAVLAILFPDYPEMQEQIYTEMVACKEQGTPAFYNLNEKYGIVTKKISTTWIDDKQWGVWCSIFVRRN